MAGAPEASWGMFFEHLSDQSPAWGSACEVSEGISDVKEHQKDYR